MKTHFSRCFIFATCLIFSVINSYAEPNKAFEIATSMKMQESGFDNYRAEMQMYLINSNGKKKNV